MAEAKGIRAGNFRYGIVHRGAVVNGTTILTVPALDIACQDDALGRVTTDRQQLHPAEWPCRETRATDE